MASSGCGSTKIVKEYVYVTDSTLTVPVFTQDTLAFEVYRNYLAIDSGHVSAFDTVSVRTEKTMVQAANLEGAYLRSFLAAILDFFRQEIARVE